MTDLLIRNVLDRADELIATVENKTDAYEREIKALANAITAYEHTLKLTPMERQLLSALEGMLQAWSAQFEGDLDSDPVAVAAMLARANVIARTSNQ